MACKDKTTGTWVAQWYEVDMYGKKKRRKKRGFKTMREAKLYENERTLKEQGDMNMLLKDFMEQYFEDKQNELKERSVRSKKQMMERHVIPYFGDMKMCDITAPQIIKWQNEMYKKDNIMEPILVRHKYARAYKDGEKQHMPVAMYKRAMAEKDAIVEDAKVEAEQIVEKAREEVEELEEEKDYLINGNGKDSAYDMPFEDWSIADLKCEKEFLINGDPDFSGDIFRGVSELEEKHSELRADIKDLEQAKEEKTAEVASVEDRYSKMWDEYEALRDGYKDKDGKHILGYNELVQRHKELLQDPARLLETEEGQQVLEEAKEEIVETVQKNLVSNMLGFIKREIFDTLKEWLVEPIYKAINEMMRGHWFQLNDNDKKILTGAIDRTVDRLVDKLDIGSKIEENVCENMPSENQIEQEVQRIYRGRGR